jgi:hypothetical protein
MFHEKRPCACRHAVRYASTSTRSQAGERQRVQVLEHARGGYTRCGAPSPARPGSTSPAIPSSGAAGSALHFRPAPGSGLDGSPSSPRRPRRPGTGRGGPASEPFTATRQPRAAAARSSRTAASRIRSVHILVRKLKLSSRNADDAGRVRSSASSKASTPGESIASKRATSNPRSRSSAAAMQGGERRIRLHPLSLLGIV